MNEQILKKKDFYKYPIIISNHAFRRWNERVEKIKNKDELIEYIINMAKIKSGIMYMCHDYYCIDNDIICCIKFDKTKNKIIIITIFGRMSEHPGLSNINEFIKHRHKYGKIVL